MGYILWNVVSICSTSDRNLSSAVKLFFLFSLGRLVLARIVWVLSYRRSAIRSSEWKRYCVAAVNLWSCAQGLR